jgi:hypothetical protein
LGDYNLDGKVDVAWVSASSSSVSILPGNGDGTFSSELVWTEHGREMRLFIYLLSGGGSWWSEEIRTYDGRSTPEWLYY